MGATKILLAEDEEDIGMMVMEALESAGYSVTWIQRPAAGATWEATVAGVVMLQGTHLLLTDWRLKPGGDGVELLRWLRLNAEGLGALPIAVLMSGSPQGPRMADTLTTEGLIAGFIAKPFCIADLLALIAGLTRGSTAHAPLASAPTANR